MLIFDVIADMKTDLSQTENHGRICKLLRSLTVFGNRMLFNLFPEVSNI